jgi:hypothetical protein
MRPAKYNLAKLTLIAVLPVSQRQRTRPVTSRILKSNVKVTVSFGPLDRGGLTPAFPLRPVQR